MGSNLIKFVLTAFICAVLCGCASKRTITHQQEENATHAEITHTSQDLGERLVEAVTSAARIDTSTTESVMHVVVYDTERIDSTGEHPVKAVAHIETHRRNAIIEQQRDTIKIAENIAKSDSVAIITSDTTAVKVDTSTRRKSSAAANLTSLALLLLVVFLFGISIYIYKKTK